MATPNYMAKTAVARDIVYIERTSYNANYPFQNKHQVYQYLQSVRMLCAFKKSKFSDL